MSIKWFGVIALAGLTGGAIVPLGRAAQPVCEFYKVTAPILDVRKDAENPGGYIDVLESGEIACVTRQQEVGSRQWGYVAHKLQDSGPVKPVNGWVGLRYMALQPKGAVSAPESKAPAPEAKAPAAEPKAPAAKPKIASGTPTAATPPANAEDELRFDQPVPFGPYPVRGKTLNELAKWQPIFAPIKGLDESLWKKPCTTCHKWNQERLCKQGSSYIKSAKAVFRHQHPYGGPYKLALMRWAKSGCK